MRNNLRNIRTNDPIYQLISNNIMENLPENIKQLYRGIQQLPIIATDNYFLHYSYIPVLEDSNSDNILGKVLDYYKKYVNTNDYEKIKTITTLDEDLSIIHSIKLTQKLAEILKDELENQIQQQMNNQQFQQQLRQLGILSSQQGQDQGQGGSTAVNPQEILQQLLNQAQQGNKNAQQLLQQLTSQVGNNISSKDIADAVKEAKETTEKAKDVRDLIGGRQAGKEPGGFRKLLDLAEKIVRVRNAEEVITLAKKSVDIMPRFVKVRKERSPIGEEVYGYTRTHKIEKAIPRELALPDELFYAKLVNGFTSKEKIMVKEGAYYILIDKSGSMDGERTVWARSVALALFKLARMKKRKYFLRFFDTQLYPEKPITNPYEVVDYIITIESDGGTNITKALRTALDDLKTHGLSKYTNTIIIITDGVGRVDEKLVEEFKKNNASLVAVMVDGINETLWNIAKKTKGQYMRAKLSEDGVLEIVSVASA